MSFRVTAAAAGICLLASGAASAQSAHINFCTGAQGGNYDFAGIQIKRQAQGTLAVDLKNTKGSMENLDLIASGECDAAIVQSDAYGVYVKQHPGAVLNLERGRVLYPEFLHLVCNKAAKLSKITGLRKGMTILVGPNGGGAAVSFDSFKIADPKTYADVATLPVGGKRALGLVQDGQDASCLLYVAGLASSSMTEADAFAETSGNLELVATDDSDVAKIKDAKGRSVYANNPIPSGTYPKSFQTRSLSGSSVGALSVDAIVVANLNFVEKSEASYDKLLTAIGKAVPEIKEHVAGGRK